MEEGRFTWRVFLSFFVWGARAIQVKQKHVGYASFGSPENVQKSCLWGGRFGTFFDMLRTF